MELSGPSEYIQRNTFETVISLFNFSVYTWTTGFFAYAYTHVYILYIYRIPSTHYSILNLNIHSGKYRKILTIQIGHPSLPDRGPHEVVTLSPNINIDPLSYSTNDKRTNKRFNFFKTLFRVLMYSISVTFFLVTEAGSYFEFFIFVLTWILIGKGSSLFRVYKTIFNKSIIYINKIL